MGDATLTTDPIVVTQTPQCGTELSYAVAVTKDGVTLSQQTLIILDTTKGAFEVFTDQRTDAG